MRRVTTVTLSLLAWTFVASQPDGTAGSQQSPSRPLLSIGKADAPPEEVFGRIADVEIDSAGNILILDYLALEIRWFDRTGRFRGRAGGRGSGPGELAAPQAITIDDNGRILALDPANGRISTYRLTESGLTYVDDVRSPPGYSMCARGDRVFLLTASQSALITEIDSTGTPVATFGAVIDRPPATRDPPPLSIRLELDNRGTLYCDPEAGAVVLLHERIPVVRSFSMSGEELWSTELAGFRAIRDIRSPRSGGWTLAPDPETGTAHTGMAVTAGLGRTLIVTLWECGMRTRDCLTEVRILDSSDGRETGRFAALATVVSASPEGIFVVTESPYPQIRKYTDLGSIVRR